MLRAVKKQSVMPIVCCIGEAAGIAASVSHSLDPDVRKADIAQIQTILEQVGAKYL